MPDTTILNYLNYLSAVVAVIGGFAAIGGLLQQRKQSREDAKSRQEDAERRREDMAHWQQEQDVRERHATATEQQGQELQRLVAQIAETNDPITRQQLQDQLNGQLRDNHTLEAQFTRQLNALERRLYTTRKEVTQLSGQISSITTNDDLIKHGSTIRESVDQARALIQDANQLKDQIDRQVKEGLNLDQFQREILRNIGQALQDLADQIASPTIRRVPPQEPPLVSSWGDG